MASVESLQTKAPTGFENDPLQINYPLNQPEPAPEQVVEPPQQPEQMPGQPMSINLEEQSSTPTVISTDSMRKQLEEAQKRLNQIKMEQEAGQATKEQTPVTETLTPTPTTTEETDPFQTQIDAYQKETTKQINERKKEFDRYMQRSDNLLRSQIRSIQSNFDVRRKQAEQVSANAKAASMVMGSRSGRMRYAPEIQRGIITGQENALIETLAIIDAQEMSLIAEAEQASFNRDYGTFLDKLDSLDSIAKEREKTLNELQEQMKEENERRDAEIEKTKQESQVIEQIGLGVTDPIEIFNGLNGTVPFDVIKEYTDTLPNAGVQEFEFVRGDKYNQTGYFDPSTGTFTAVNSRVLGDGTVEVNGSSVGLVTPGMSDTDIDSLNISDSAKAYVKLWQEGRITQEEILQRLGGDKADRVLRDEVIGVIAQMQTPATAVNESISTYNRNKANNAIDNVDTALNLLGAYDESGTFDFSGAAAGAKGRAFFGTAEGGPMGIGGFLGAGGSNATFVAAVESLKGMIAFGELQTMRDNSPTGGALGQVTERELDLLASQIASLDIRQSDEQLLENLEKIKDSFARVRAINSPDITADEYKAQFPDASQAEIDEIKARNTVKNNAMAPQMSNMELFNTVTGNTKSSNMTDSQLFNSIGL